MDFNKNAAMFNYRLAAERIAEELESRGFVTENPTGVTGLIEKITEIIKYSIEGNVVRTEVNCGPLTDEYLDPPYPWESDLQNQL